MAMTKKTYELLYGNLQKKRKSAASAGFVNPIKWGANFAKSTILSTRDIMKNDLAPNLVKFHDVNKPLIRETERVLRNPGQLKAEFEKLTSNGEFGEAKKLIKFALNDLKTGSFYDSTRDRTLEGEETAKLFDDFGSEENYFDESSEGSSYVESEHSFSEKEIVKEEIADKRVQSTNSTIVGSIDVMMKNQNAMYNHEMQVNQIQHSQSLVGLANITQTLNSTMGTAMEQQASLFDTLIGKVDEVNTSINNLIEYHKSQEGETIAKEERYTDPAEDIFRRNSFDINKYFQNVVKQTDREYGISNALTLMTGGLSPGQLIEVMKSNPLQFVTGNIGKALLPKDFKENLKSLDSSMKGFFPSMIMRLNDMAKDSDNFFGEMFGKALGYKGQQVSQIDTRIYQQEQTDWLQKIGKATTEVIPMYLSDIASSLSGNKQKIFDYAEGRFMDMETVAYDSSRRMNNITNHMTKTTSNIERRMNKMGITDDAKDVLLEDMRTYLRDKAKDGSRLDITGEYKNSMGFVGGRKSFDVLKGIISSMDRKDILEMNREILLAPSKLNEYGFNENAKLHKSGLIAAYNDYSDMSDFIQRGTDGDPIHDNELTIDRFLDRDKVTKNGTLGVLNDILSTLRQGIVTYPVQNQDLPKNVRGRLSNKGIYGKAYLETEPASDARHRVLGIADAENKYFGAAEVDMAKEKDRIADRKRIDRQREFEKSLKERTPFIDVNSSIESVEAQSYFKNLDLKTKAEAEEKVEQEKKNNFFYRKLTGNSAFQKANNLVGKAQEYLGNPFKLVTSSLEFLDQSMFKLVYGEDYDMHFDVNGLPTEKMGSLFGSIANAFSASIDKLTGWLHEAIFGENSWLRKNVSVGSRYVREKFIDGAYSKGKKFLVGEKGAGDNGEDTKGILSPTLDRLKEIKTGVTTNLGGRSQIADAWKNQETIDEMKKEGLDPNLSIMGNFSYEMSKSASSIRSKFSRFLFGDDIIDEDGKATKTKSRETYDMVTGELKGFLPKGIAGGLVGGGLTLASGLLTGLYLPGGPMLGALIGATGSLVNHSDKFREYLFGKETIDEDGNPIFKKGMFDTEIVDGFKKYAPKIAVGAGSLAFMNKFGILGGSLLPGGPLGAALIGSIGGMIAASDDLKEMLFGKDADADSGLFSKNTRSKVFDKLINTGVGAGLGFGAASILSNFGILGSLVLPGGPLVGTVMGGMAGLFSQTSLKEYFFGKEDEKGEKVHKGIFDRLFTFTKEEYVDPLFAGINKAGHSIKDWFKESVIDEFKSGLTGNTKLIENAKKNINEAFSNFGTYVKEGVNGTFEKFLGMPLEEIVREKINKPLKNAVKFIFNGLGKAMGAIIASPFKLFGAMGRNADEIIEDGNVSRAIRKNRRSKRNDKRKNRQASKAKFTEAMKNSSAWDILSTMFTFNNGMDPDFEPSPDKAQEIIEQSATSPSGGVDQSKVTNALDPNTPDKQKKSWWSRWQDERDEARTKRLSQKEDRQKLRHEERLRRTERYEKKTEAIKSRDKAKKDADKKSTIESNETALSKGSDFVFTKRFRKSILSMNTSLRDIRDEVKGQLGGVGYNLAYIRNILAGSAKDGSSFDPGLSGSERFDYQQDTAWGKVKRFGRGVRNKVTDGRDWVVDKLYDTFETFFGPASIIGKVIHGIGFGFNIIGKAGSVLKNTVLGAGSIIKEFGVSVAGGIGEGIGSMFASVGNSIEALTYAMKGFSAHLGDLVGQVATSFMDGVNILTGAIETGFSTAFDILKVGLPKLVLGLGSGLAKMATGAGWAAWDFGVGVHDWLKDRRAGRKAVKKEKKVKRHLGTFQLSGGTLDEVKSFNLPTANGMHQGLELISIIKGKVLGKRPSHALPVYILGSETIPTKPGKTDKNKSKREGDQLSDTVDSFDRKDPNKLIDDLTSDGTTPDEKTDIQIALAAEQLEEQKKKSDESKSKKKKDDEDGFSLLEALGLGNILNTGKNVGMAGLGVLGALGGLVKGVMPLAGTARAFMGRDYDRVGINVIKSSKTLKGMADRGVMKGVKGVGSIIDGFQDGKMLSKIGQETGEKLTKTEMLGLGMRKITDKITKPLTEGWKYGDLAKATGTKLTTGEALGTAAKKATDLGSKTLQSIKGGLDKVLGNSKLIKMIGGSKMAKGLSKLSKELVEKLVGKSISKKMLAKFIARVSPAGIAFLLYDVSTGMAEAGNIFKVSGMEITMKMRAASGLSKMLSGLLWGLIPDSWIADMAYKLLADPEEEKQLEAGRTKLKMELNAYNTTNRTNYNLDQYNDKVANKRVFTQVVDGVKGIAGGIKDGAEKLGAGIKNFLSPSSSSAKSVAEASLMGTVSNAEVSAAGLYGLLELSATGSLSMGTLSTISSIMTKALPASSRVGSLYSGLKPSFGRSLIEGAGTVVNSPKKATDSKTLPRVVDGMYYYSQNDPQYSLGGQYSLDSSGCGPTSAAMVIKSYGKDITPKIAANKLIKGGFKAKDGGTDPNFFVNLGKEYGVKFNVVPKNKQRIITELMANRPVVLMGKKSGVVTRLYSAGLYGNMGGTYSNKDYASPFGDTMHYVVASSYNKVNNSVNILDPENAKSGMYDLDVIYPDITTVLFSSDPAGNGIDKESNTKKANSAIIAAQHKELNEAIKSKGGTMSTRVEGLLQKMGPGDTEGLDEGTSKEYSSNPMSNLYDLLGGIGSFFDNIVGLRFGFNSPEGILSSMGEIVNTFTPSEFPTPGKQGYRFPGSKWITGDADIHDWFGNRLVKVAEAFGLPLHITSGYRSVEEQERIANDTLRNNPGYYRGDNGAVYNSKGEMMVAPPGRSRHNGGLAADVADWAKDLSNADLKPFKLWKPMGYESWHVEPLETQVNGVKVKTEELIKKYGLPTDSYRKMTTEKEAKLRDDGRFGLGNGLKTQIKPTVLKEAEFGKGSIQPENIKPFTTSNIDNAASYIERLSEQTPNTVVNEMRQLREDFKKSVNSAGDSINEKLLEVMLLMNANLEIVAREIQKVSSNTENISADKTVVVASGKKQPQAPKKDPSIPKVEIDHSRRHLVDKLIERTI